jgi:hypothetical protein
MWKVTFENLNCFFAIDFFIGNIFLQFFGVVSSRDFAYNFVVLGFPSFSINFFDS